MKMDKGGGGVEGGGGGVWVELSNYTWILKA